MPDGSADLLSADPLNNPLLDLGLRPDLYEPWLVVLGVVFIAAFCYASFCDLWRGRLTPNWFTHGLIAFALLAGPLLFEDWVAHLVVGALMGLMFIVLWRIGGIGMGDVKLFTGLGLMFGLAGILMVALAQILSVLVSLPIAIATRQGRKMPVPMFPFTALATLIGLWALGADGALVGAGALALALACAAGLIERRWWPPRGLADLAQAVVSGEEVAVRLRPLERPMAATADGGWAAPESGGAGRVRRRDLDVLSHELLDLDQQGTLDRVGEVETTTEVSGSPLRVRFIEGFDGYTLEVGRV